MDELCDKIRIVVENLELRQEMGKNTRKLYENTFSPTIFKENLMNIINDQLLEFIERQMWQYMAKICFDYYTGEDIYNDGDVEEKLLHHYSEKIEIDKGADNYFYLTTHIRENILNWYPFKDSDEVLEIGSGCGTLTGMLCQKCGFVTSIEGSKRRAKITLERNLIMLF